MKKLIIILGIVFSTLLLSCDVKTNDTINGTKVENGEWVYSDSAGKNIMSTVTYYKVSPSWSQSFDFANKRSDNKYYVAGGIILLLIFVIAGIGIYKSASWLPKWNTFKASAVMFLLLACGVQLIVGNAYGVRWNNDKWVKKEVYDNAIQTYGSTKPIWDSLEVNCLIVDGPYNCSK